MRQHALVALVAGLLVPVAAAQQPKPDAEQERAVAAIEKLGGKVGRDEKRPGKPVVRVDLDGPDVTDAALAYLAAFPDLMELSVRRSRVTDVGLGPLARLKRLTALSIEGTPGVTDAGVERLRPCTALRELSLTETRVTGKGLEHFPDLELLNLSGTPFGDDGLRHLAGLLELRVLLLLDTRVTDEGLRHLPGRTRLWALGLAYCQVTDAGLRYLEGFRLLSFLSLAGTQVSDQGMPHLGACSLLRDLSLNDTRVTDAGLQHLKGLKGLRELDVVDTPVSAGGVKKLKEALPRLEVVRTEEERERKFEELRKRHKP